MKTAEYVRNLQRLNDLQCLQYELLRRRVGRHVHEAEPATTQQDIVQGVLCCGCCLLLPFGSEAIVIGKADAGGLKLSLLVALPAEGAPSDSQLSHPFLGVPPPFAPLPPCCYTEIKNGMQTFNRLDQHACFQ